MPEKTQLDGYRIRIRGVLLIHRSLSPDLSSFGFLRWKPGKRLGFRAGLYRNTSLIGVTIYGV